MRQVTYMRDGRRRKRLKMSPLNDVTNTVAPDIAKDAQFSLCTNSTSKESKMLDCFALSLQESLTPEPKPTKDVISVTKCNKTEVYCKRKKLSTRSSHSASEITSPCISLLQRQESSPRVPPLPNEDQLSEALATLDLSKKRIEDAKLSQTRESNVSKGRSIDKPECKDKLSGSSNSVQTPPGSFASTYQCVACSLEFSSMENLTCHLVRHIYEGLYAASWLSNAMATLLPSSPISSNNGEKPPGEGESQTSQVSIKNSCTDPSSCTDR